MICKKTLYIYTYIEGIINTHIHNVAVPRLQVGSFLELATAQPRDHRRGTVEALMRWWRWFSKKNLNHAETETFFKECFLMDWGHTYMHTYIHTYIYIYISHKSMFRGLEVPWVYPHIISISGSHWWIQPLDGSSCSQWRFISSIFQWQRIFCLFPYWGYLSSLDHQLINLIKFHDDFQNMMIFHMHVDIKYIII
jgi:hypothetical protein